MPRWRRLLRVNVHGFSPRSFSSAASERVEVRCGSAGHVTIDLFNVPGRPTSEPLLIHLPPFPQADGSACKLPIFLQNRPVASINYRWRPFSTPSKESKVFSPLHWPTPVHDTAFAFAWLVESLAPPKHDRRDIYIYGSYLGASLAASLALTEAHTHARFGVRGLIAYNGVYNWTMFLPDHRINKPPKRTKVAAAPPGPAEGSQLHRLQERMPAMFDAPSNLFDPFASPSLFFHSPGLLVPQSFFMTLEHSALIENMMNDEEIPPLKPIKAPRKSHLVFPPRQSTLKIPDTLLLFDSAPLPVPKPSTKPKSARPRKRAKPKGHSFGAQAAELAELMRRSVDVVELKERSKWDEDVHTRVDEALRRVQVMDVGLERDGVELGDAGHDAVTTWLESR
ncbi:uncharacterized protein MAM_02713 [Metarhizium album ARSEF 1941]|uniref:Alpha/beta hydrolase fold-3 n=1 Tax=Metarhizium album (strain ARSEF 1941) TaxID=1081103 RepID=A0A0B2X1P1_METAS|nr:uncharacterized protein MAM_02713 [Metarhizium album ARSEF 1941]KHN99015.1 hypothetical protein MAM_02713 [Metarhizium album ARSEF 1941]